MKTDIDIDEHGIYSNNKLLLEMIDQKKELGLGIDLDLSGNKIEQGSNNVIYSDQDEKAVFPSCIDLNNSGIHNGNTFLVCSAGDALYSATYTFIYI